MVSTKKDKRAMLIKLLVVILVMTVMVMMSAGLSSQGVTNVSLEIVVQDGCPVEVNDESDSCGEGQGGPGTACATAGATVLHWHSTGGEEFSINFKDKSPLGSGRNYSSNSQGSLTAPVPASAEAGDYYYGVSVGSCEMDPKIVVGK